MPRKCIACGFEAKNYGSLTRHLDKCLVARGQKRRRIPRAEDSLAENELHRLRQELGEMQRILGEKEAPNTANEVTYDEALQFLSVEEAANETSDISSVEGEAAALEARSRAANYLRSSKTVVNRMQASATSINCDFFNSGPRSTAGLDQQDCNPPCPP